MPPKPISAYRKIVDQVLASDDWVFDGIDGTGHARLLHIPTGQTTTYAIHTESDRNGVRNTAKDIERISGMKVWERSSRKPSRKKPHVSGYSPRKSAEEKAVSTQVALLYDELDAVNASLFETHPQRHRGRAIQLARRRLEIEEELEALYQPKERPG